MSKNLDAFWGGFGAQLENDALEKTAIAVPLARLAGKVQGLGSKAVSSMVSGGRNTVSSIVGGGKSLVSGAKALPGKISKGYQEGVALGSGKASSLSSRPAPAVPTQSPAQLANANRIAAAKKAKAAPVKAAPVKAAPVKAAPVKAAPVKAAPVQAVPTQSPAQLANANRIAADKKVKAAPVQAAPVQAAPAAVEHVVPATAHATKAEVSSVDTGGKKPLTGVRRRGADLLTGGLVGAAGVSMLGGGGGNQNQY